MGYELFKPEILANELMTDRHRVSVFKNLLYKGPILGEIKNKGDILHICGVGRPTVRDYTQGSDITIETQDVYSQDLRITEAKYVSVTLDDIDAKQMQGEVMSTHIGEAKEALGRTYDEFFAKYYSSATNTITDASFDEETAIDVVLEAEQKLLEYDVPSGEEKFLVVSPAINRVLKKTKIVFKSNNDAMFGVKGYEGEFCGFNVFVSNAVQNNGSTTDYCMAFTRQAIAGAEQIPPSKIEKFRPQKRFEDAFKVLHLYGGTVIRPNELVCLTLTPAS